MRKPPAAHTLESQGARDSGLMSPVILQQLSSILSTDIAIHHRELIGGAEGKASPGTIQQSRSNGRNTTLASYYESKDTHDFVPHMYEEGYILASLSYLIGIETVTRLPVIRTQQTSSPRYSEFALELSDAPYLEAMLMPCTWTYENLGLATTIGFTLNLPNPSSGKDLYHSPNYSPNICFFGTVNRSVVITKDFLKTVYDLGRFLTKLSGNEFNLTGLDNRLAKNTFRNKLSVVK